MRVWPGRSYPLGASRGGRGTNFALLSEHARGVRLCFFDGAGGAKQAARVRLQERPHFIWPAPLPDVRPGQLQGHRVEGPHARGQGHRFKPAKLLVDPCARAISGPVDRHASLFGFGVAHPDEDLSRDSRDSAAFMPRCVVVNEGFPCGDDPAPRTPLGRPDAREAAVTEARAFQGHCGSCS